MSDGAVLDLLFVQDATGSMGEYIDSAKNSIVEICKLLVASGKLREQEGLQVGLLAYRDYPVEENDFVIKAFPFTFSVVEMENYLAPLEAIGGGDRPEAFTTALEYAYTEMKGWRDEALKAIVVITDAAPHGIDEKFDSYPNGAPKDVALRDPIELVRDMAEDDYSIFILACEPTLGRTTEYAIDLYKALSHLSLGTFWSLTDHRLLAAYIIGFLLERIELRSLSLEYRMNIARRVLEDGLSVDDATDELHMMLIAKGQKVTTLQTGNVYNDLDTARHNYDVFISSASLAEARKSLKRVHARRLNTACLRGIKDSRNAFAKVRIGFRNLGRNRISLQIYDANVRQICEDVIVPDNFVILKEFDINIPVNFVLQCGRETKNFSRTFAKNEDIDVDYIFNHS